MGKKNYYSVAKGRQPGIYLDWSSCEINISKYKGAVFKGFVAIDQAINFLFAGNAYLSCKDIPVYDSNDTKHNVSEFGHTCSGQSGTCDIDSLTVDLESSGSENEETEVLKVYSGNNANESNSLSVTVNPNDDHTSNVSNKNENKPEDDQMVHVNKTNPVSSSAETRTCLVHCGQADNADMLNCYDCKGWIHFTCTKLPSYQLYSLIKTKRRYSCETCIEVPASFSLKFPDPCLQTNSDTNNQTSKNVDLNSEQNHIQNVKELTSLFSKLETNLVTTISESNKLYLEKDIDSLKTELANEKQKSNQLQDRVTKLSAEKAELNQRCKDETSISSIQQQLENIKQTNSTIQNVLTQMNKSNQQSNNTMSQLTTSVKDLNETVVQNTSVETKLDDLLTTVEQVKVDLQSKDVRKQKPVNKPEHVSTSNRFSALDSDNEEDHYRENQTNSYENQKGKIIMIGNSHFRPIIVDNFIQQYETEKHIAYSCEEAKKILDKIVDPVDCFIFHVFSKDIADNESGSIDAFQNFIDYVRDKWSTTPIIISDALPRGDDLKMNEILQEFNINLRHTYLKHPFVKVCDNSCLGMGGRIITRFMSQDRLHLSRQGTKILVSNIKSLVRNSLCLPEPTRMSNRGIQRFSLNQRGGFKRPYFNGPTYYPGNFDFNLSGFPGYSAPMRGGRRGRGQGRGFYQQRGNGRGMWSK